MTADVIGFVLAAVIGLSIVSVFVMAIYAWWTGRKDDQEAIPPKQYCYRCGQKLYEARTPRYSEYTGEVSSYYVDVRCYGGHFTSCYVEEVQP